MAISGKLTRAAFSPRAWSIMASMAAVLRSGRPGITSIWARAIFTKDEFTSRFFGRPGISRCAADRQECRACRRNVSIIILCLREYSL